MRFALAIFIGRLVRRLVRMVRPGGGSALPGLVLSKLAPGLLRQVWNRFPEGVVVITGSAGKSSTTKMLAAILRAHGKSVFTNPSTANILQGFFAAILEVCGWNGRVGGDIAVLEVDEGHAAEILRNTSARFVTVLNVTDDQLDRFVDPELVREKLSSVAKSATDGVILNANDQNMLQLAKSGAGSLARTSFFGFPQALIKNRFMGFAETYLEKLDTPQIDTEVTSVIGREVVLTNNGGSAEFQLANRGIHYAADAAAAIETAARVLQAEFDLKKSAVVIESLPPVFARGEVTNINGREVELILVQNPASFQLNLDAFADPLENVMIAIGRDVHDPSWLWTVNYSKIRSVSVVTGYNAFEMQLCLSYKGIRASYVNEDLQEALDEFFDRTKNIDSRLTILLSADAMRRYRRMLGFISPEMVGLS